MGEQLPSNYSKWRQIQVEWLVRMPEMEGTTRIPNAIAGELCETSGLCLNIRPTWRGKGWRCVPLRVGPWRFLHQPTTRPFTAPELLARSVPTLHLQLKQSLLGPYMFTQSNCTPLVPTNEHSLIIALAGRVLEVLRLCALNLCLPRSQAMKEGEARRSEYFKEIESFYDRHSQMETFGGVG